MFVLVLILVFVLVILLGIVLEHFDFTWALYFDLGLRTRTRKFVREGGQVTLFFAFS